MATTDDNVNHVRIEGVNLWADQRGNIHLTTNDPDVKDRFRVVVNDNENSQRRNPAYPRLARLLVSYGKTVPGYDPDADNEA